MTLGAYTVRSEVRIDRPIEDVWAIVSDPENDPKWCRLVSGTARDEGGPGRRYRFVQQLSPIRRKGTTEIVSEDAPRRLQMRTRVMGGEFLGTYTLEERRGSTLFAHVNDVRWSGPMRVMAALQERVTKRIMHRQLESLKALLEANREPPGGHG